jgi:phosphatidylethanolamine N-methyltransferase
LAGIPKTVLQVRYHHDGKYNVMSIDGAFEIYGESLWNSFVIVMFIVDAVEQAMAFDFASVRETLMRIVPLCLDSDPSLIPLSCQPSLPDTAIPSAEDDRDPDDFRFWSERQAKRICVAIKEAFGVDYVPEVIVADANLSALANRIVLSKEILTG